MDEDFGELDKDERFKKIVQNFENCLAKIEKSVDAAINVPDVHKLTSIDNAKLNTYLGYTINSLYWMMLKLHGKDFQDHEVKMELGRIKEVVVRTQFVQDGKTKRPAIDKAAAERFVKRGLHVRFDEYEGNVKLKQTNDADAQKKQEEQEEKQLKQRLQKQSKLKKFKKK